MVLNFGINILSKKIPNNIHFFLVFFMCDILSNGN